MRTSGKLARALTQHSSIFSSDARSKQTDPYTTYYTRKFQINFNNCCAAAFVCMCIYFATRKIRAKRALDIDTHKKNCSLAFLWRNTILTSTTAMVAQRSGWLSPSVPKVYNSFKHTGGLSLTHTHTHYVRNSGTLICFFFLLLNEEWG